MKKFLALFLALMLCFAFVGCGDNSSDAPKASEPIEQETEESAYPVTLEDNDFITFEITGYDDTWDEYSYTVKNKTDKDLNFSVEKAIANDEYTVDTWVYSEIGAGTKASDTFTLDNNVMDNLGDGETVKIEFNYQLVDNDTFDTVKEGSFAFDITK